MLQRRAGLGAIVIVLAALVDADAAVLCQKKSGALFARATCKKKETLADPVALGLQGPKGDKGDPGRPGIGVCEPTYTNNGDGTVMDSCTGLQWEQKALMDRVVNYADPHDPDNYYALSATGTAPDGTAFTQFLAQLNTPPCFAGHCDWRLPDVNELRTLLLQQYPCTLANPCVAPELGPTMYDDYWSGTDVPGNPTVSWFVWFWDGSVNSKEKGNLAHARAVRPGP